MTSIHPETLRPGPTQSWMSRGSVLRLALGTVAVLVLIALGIQDPKLTASSTSAGSDPTPAAIYDGRGKWSGY